MTRFQRSVAASVGMWMVLGGSVFCCCSPARADPDVITPAPPPVPPIGWPQLGRPDRLDIFGADTLVDTDVPVPPGVTPGILVGQIGSAVNVAGGRVDVIDGRGVHLGDIPVPGDPGSAPFAVDISAALITDGVAKLSFVLRESNPPGDSCVRPPSVTLSQLGSNYLGESPYPASVADFRPGYAEEFIIRTGAVPTTAQQQAALELVARLTRYYRPVPVRIDVDTSPDPLPPGPPTRRVIELIESDSAGMAVRDPNSPDAALLISGRGDELSRQVALFADRRIELAQASSATVTAATAEAPKAATIKTFAQLGMTGEISVLGNATLYIGFDAGQFAVGPIERASVHLIAHYTPVGNGEASMVIRSGNSVLATRRLDDSGQLDVTGAIPAAAIGSTVGIAVQLRYLPRQRCAPLNDRMQFSVDPGSTVAVTPGSHNRGGFPVLPMAFTPEFNVSVDAPEHLRYAARAINLLAQQTGVDLLPRVTSLTEAVSSGLGALIVGSGQELVRAGLQPPISTDGASQGTVDIDGVPATDVDLNGSIGVVQAFSHRGATVLAIDADADWNLVDRSFDYIAALPSRWAALTGDVVATGAAGRTVNLTIREGGALMDDYPGDGWKWWTRVTLASLGAAFITGTAILLRRRRRKQALP